MLHAYFINIKVFPHERNNDNLLYALIINLFNYLKLLL